MNLLVVEDNLHVRAGLVAAMRGIAGAAVEGCGTVSEALALVDRWPVDVALVDVGLPDGSGLQVIHRVRAVREQARVFVISVLDDDETIVAALRAGANGYVLKHASPAELVASVEEALTRGVVMSPHVAQRVAISFWPSERGRGVVRLSKREVELLEHLQCGRTYEGAAAAMHLQLGTVQSYIKRIYTKLGVSTKVEVLRVATQQGWLRP